MLYYYLLDSRCFADCIQPALCLSWQQRSFAPCRQLCRELLAGIKNFFPAGDQNPLFCQVADGLAFDRRLWHHLVGELLMYSATEVPPLETPAEALCCLLAPKRSPDSVSTRQHFAPIEQVLYGSRDLVFGGAFYRPDFAGWNNAGDVSRLSEYLAAQDPNEWQATPLESMRDLVNDSERAAELNYARQWFEPLRDLYRMASDANHVIVCEVLA